MGEINEWWGDAGLIYEDDGTPNTETRIHFKVN